ncbi:MAG TPA: acylphosphatase [Anaerolineae bacterium]|nr:acylphosphatase [Anaerolineae bacterium]
MQHPEGSVRLSAVVRGRVQGVGFRYHTRQRATELGLTGSVRNRWDGSVEVLAEGPRRQLEDLLAFLREGPPSAFVTEVEVQWSAASCDHARFEVQG